MQNGNSTLHEQPFPTFLNKQVWLHLRLPLVHSRHRRDNRTLLLVQRVVVDGPVRHARLLRVLVVVGQRVLHPVVVVAVGVVLVCVRAPALLPPVGRVHRRGGRGEEVAKLERLDQVRVPDEAAVGDLDVVDLLDNLVDLRGALGEGRLGPVHGRLVLHYVLHLRPDLGRGYRPVGVAELVELGDAVHPDVRGGVGDLVAGTRDVGYAVGARPAEDDDVEQRVGAEAVRAVDGRGGRLAGGEEAGDDLVRLELAVLAEVGADDLPVVIRRYATHVVVDRGKDGDGLLRHVDAGEDGGGLRDARQALGEEVRGQVVEVEVAVVLLGSHATSLAYLHGHGAAHDVPAGEVLGARGITLHEPLALRVSQDAALAAAALGDEAARPVDARGVELDELRVLVGESGAHGHGVPVPGAGVRGRAAEVGPAVPPGGEDRVVRVDAVYGPVLHVDRHGPHAPAVGRHEQVHGEVLDEVGGVERQAAAVQGVEHGVPGPVGRARAPVRLATLPVLEALPPERALVDLPLLGPGEGQAELLELEYRLGRLAAHVVDGVLVAQPVGALDRVVHVPPPVVLAHVPEGRVDAPLRRDGVGPRGEELRDARRL
ncbi:hypothetical protein THAOC_22107, partial [Thalassiosira oceanica]